MQNANEILRALMTTFSHKIHQDDATGDPRPRKRLRYSPRHVQYQYPRQDSGDLTDSAISGLTSIIDEGTSILLPSDTATASDGPATRTRTRTRTRNSTQGGTSDGVSSTVDGGSSTTGAVSDSGDVTGTACKYNPWQKPFLEVFESIL